LDQRAASPRGPSTTLFRSEGARGKHARNGQTRLVFRRLRNRALRLARRWRRCGRAGQEGRGGEARADGRGALVARQSLRVQSRRSEERRVGKEWRSRWGG